MSGQCIPVVILIDRLLEEYATHTTTVDNDVAIRVATQLVCI